MPRTLSGLLLTFALALLTAASAEGDDKKKAPKPTPPAKAGGAKGSPAKGGGKSNQAPAHPRPLHPPDEGKFKTATTVSPPLDLKRSEAAKATSLVLFFEKGILSRRMPAGQLVHLLLEDEVGGGRFTKVAAGKTNAEEMVTFRFKVPPRMTPGVYRILAVYPGGPRWQPSESGRRFVTIK